MRQRFTATARAIAGFCPAKAFALLCFCCTLALGMLCAAAARAELPAETSRGMQSATLAVPAPKHWVWVDDFVFPHMADGMA